MSGNVADFCCRWGARYRYMIVLDADSVMTGGILRRLRRDDGYTSRGPHPDSSAAFHGPHVVPPHAAVCIEGLCPALRRGLELLAPLRRKLPAQPRSSACVRSSSIATSPIFRENPAPPHPQPRYCRGRAHAPRRLRRLVRVLGGRQLRGRASEFSDSLAPRSTLVSGQLQHFWFLFAPKIDFANRFHIWRCHGLPQFDPVVHLPARRRDLAIKYRSSMLSALPGAATALSFGGAVMILLSATLAPSCLLLSLAFSSTGQVAWRRAADDREHIDRDAYLDAARSRDMLTTAASGSRTGVGP